MDIIILYVSLQLVLFMVVLAVVELRGIRKILEAKYITPKSNDVIMSEDDKKEFMEEDQKRTTEFMASIAALNEFMTGQDFSEDVKHVGKQEI